MGTIEKALRKKVSHSHNAVNTAKKETADVLIESAVKKAPVEPVLKAAPDVADESIALTIAEMAVPGHEELDINTDAAIKNAVSSNAVKNKVSSKSVEIDMNHLINQGFLTPDDGQSVISEEFRQIKRPLLNNIRGKSAHPIEKANLIQVTSSLQNEGKTFNAINLAMAIAMEMDFKVLLVDADVIKPSVSKDLNIEAGKGLVEYLSGEVTDLSEVLLTTNIPKLTLLPAGNRHNLTTELVSSEVMDQLFTELSERYSDRVVIIDTPPILQTNESVIISQKVGQIVFVVEQNRTTQAALESAIDKLDADAVIGVVMNKSRSGDKGSYYGYGYGYGAE